MALRTLSRRAGACSGERAQDMAAPLLWLILNEELLLHGAFSLLITFLHTLKHTRSPLRYSKTGPVGFLNPTSCHPHQSSNPNQNFIKLRLDKYTLLLKFEWNFYFILSTSILSFTPGTILLQAAAKPHLCSAQLQNPSCNAWKKPWQCLGYSCTETAVYHVYKYCLISSPTISSACAICCLLWHVQTELFTAATAFFCACTQLHQCSHTARSPKATVMQKINQVDEKIPPYLLSLSLPFGGGAPGQTHPVIHMGRSVARGRGRLSSPLCWGWGCATDKEGPEEVAKSIRSLENRTKNAGDQYLGIPEYWGPSCWGWWVCFIYGRGL